MAWSSAHWPCPVVLHLVEQDICTSQFPTFLCTHLTLSGNALREEGDLCSVYVFTRRQTSEQVQCNFRLSCLGARSLSPRSWCHVPVPKALDVSAPAQRFFKLRMARVADLGGAGAWHRWSEKLDFGIDKVEDGSDEYRHYTHASPMLHPPPHLLRVLGPSSLTLYKDMFVFWRKLINAQPPIEQRASSARWLWI
ncbi:hypothetical protein EDB87DRAFT_510552 [Lactarius vividus]|nr:hypothetical protein EDB87DRAFT_510552 [Lactarius vividus]